MLIQWLICRVPRMVVLADPTQSTISRLNQLHTVSMMVLIDFQFWEAREDTEA
jgi:hypothetical protein